jgi:hypothetical protein
MTPMAWSSSALPGCCGHPCEVLRTDAGVVRVWQESPITARGAWCWKLNGQAVQVTRGNRGSAKSAAKRALLRAAHT